MFVYSLRYLHRPAIFYINTMNPCGAGIAGKLLGKKVIYHIHETYIKPEPLKLFLRFVIQHCADQIIFVSKYLYSVEQYKAKRQCIISNTVKNEEKAPIKCDGSCFGVVMICSLKRYKGVDEFVDIAGLLEGINDISFTLVLNATSDEIARYFKNRSIGKNLTIFDRQSDVARFYTSSKILLNLSHPDECTESFGLTVLEAMSYGLVVIAPPVGGPAEIVEDGFDGILIPCYEEQKIATEIVYLKQNVSRYEELSKNALVKAKKYSYQRFKESITKLLREASEGL